MERPTDRSVVDHYRSTPFWNLSTVSVRLSAGGPSRVVKADCRVIVAALKAN